MFVKRNANNEIVLVSKERISGVAEEHPDADSYELVDFIQNPAGRVTSSRIQEVG
ncbi:hypothetical protein ALON55S_03896 [Alishewanella longhuensis]